MPAKDLYHEAVRVALVKDGWKITNDPYTIKFEEIKLFADLAAERMFVAQRDSQKIIVEIKSFLGLSFINDLKKSIGQYVIYQKILSVKAPEYDLYLAIDRDTYATFFLQRAVQFIVQASQVSLLIFNVDEETIEQWIKQPLTES